MFALLKKSQYKIVGVLFDFAANSILSIGKNFSSGPCEFRLREQKNIYIGDDNMYSSNITFWTSDGHAILDKKTGKCINHGGNIVIGNHVWIGHGVRILKKSCVNDNSVVGGGTVVNKIFNECFVVIAGVPGKIIRREVNWNRKSPMCFA